MEQKLKSRIDAPAGFLAALRHRIRMFKIKRQHRQDMKSLSELPKHLLRDIGYEYLATPRVYNDTLIR